MMKAILLARVSDKEQEEGHSLAAQQQRLRDYCRRKGLEAIRTVAIVESSTRGERKEFSKLIAFAKRQSEMIAIVADAVDRVQRGFKESVYLDELIRAGKIELHFIREGMILGKEAKSSDVMRWDFSVMAAKSYVLQLSDNVKRSIEYKLRNGEIIGQAPPGYLNATNPYTGKKTVVLDPERSPIIQEMFRLYATGAHSIEELAKLASKTGYKSRMKGRGMTRATLHNVLKNPFYYGQMRIKGIIYDHFYPTLITKDVFNACEAVRAGWDKKPFQWRGKEYIFRGILTCAVTGAMATADTKTKKYKNGGEASWTYLIVADPENPEKKKWVREDLATAQVAEILQGFRIGETHMRQIREWLKNTLDAETVFHKEQTDLLRKRLETVGANMRRLTEMLVEGHIAPDEHAEMREKYMTTRAELQAKLKMHEKGDDGFVSTRHC